MRKMSDVYRVVVGKPLGEGLLRRPNWWYEMILIFGIFYHTMVNFISGWICST
jgi:hypothetical protein